MRVLIDAHMVGENESGNETYTLNLIRGLRESGVAGRFLLAATDPELLMGKAGAGDRFEPVRVSSSPWRRLFIDMPRIAADRKASLLHVIYSAPFWRACPLVVTVHDVCFRRHPEWFSSRDLAVLRLGVGLTLRRADAIITISRFSQKEICDCYGIAPDRVHVIPIAAATQFRILPDDGGQRERLGAMSVRPPYLLAVGNLQPRKNLCRLIEAFALLKRNQRIPHQLVIAGKARWKESAVYAAARKQEVLGDIIFTGYVGDDDLVTLYNRADIFVYPSLYEGFGLPVLEAMACGAPVVSSNVSAIPEVAGDAAVLVDPHDVDALASALAGILADPTARANMVERGLARARAFSWASTAKETWAVYRRIAGETGPVGTAAGQ